MNVLKFGGTSIQDANAMKLVKKIVLNNTENHLIVLSACKGITNKLIRITALLPHDYSNSLAIFEEIKEHHLQICTDLKLGEESISKINSELKKLQNLIEAAYLLNYLSKNTEYKIIATGEYLSSRLFFEYIKTQIKEASLVNSSQYILRDSKTGDIEVINKKNLEKTLLNNSITISQGFICRNKNNEIRNLGRGGSDHSASIFAAELDAEELQIWTDVNGIMSGDPRYFKNALTKQEVSFDTMRKIAFFGAKVLHPESLQPAIINNIPIKILNTFEYNNEGTLVVEKSSKNTIPAIVQKNNCELFRLYLSGISKVSAVMNVVYQNLEKLHLEPFYSDILDNSAIFIFEENTNSLYSKKLIENIKFKKKVNLIYIADIDNEIIEVIIKDFTNKDVLHYDIDMENQSILMIMNSNSNFNYEKLHDMIISN